jgi:hypothetical protein
MKESQFKMLRIYNEVSTTARGRVESGQKAALCFKGRKWTYCIVVDYPVRVVKRPVGDFDRCTGLPRAGKVYPVPEGIKSFRDVAKRCGITKAAEQLLAKAEADAENMEDIEDTLLQEAEMETVENPKPIPEGVPGEEADATIPATENEETATVTTKSKAKRAPKAKKPAKAKAAPKAKKPAKVKTEKVKGDTPFRPGSMKEKAFIAYKAERKDYDAMERGGKGEWADKLAKKLGASGASIRSWISGAFQKALGK